MKAINEEMADALKTCKTWLGGEQQFDTEKVNQALALHEQEKAELPEGERKEALDAILNRLVELHNIAHESICEATDAENKTARIDCESLGEIMPIIKLYSKALQQPVPKGDE